MKRVKMIMSGVVALALVCFLSVPMVQAQGLDGTTHEVKISGSLAVIEDAALNSNISREGGKETVPVVLRVLNGGTLNDAGGFDYEIKLLIDTGPDVNCDEETVIGTFSTYGDNEDVALGELSIDEFPEPDQTFIGRFFAKVKIKEGNSNFKSVAGWFEIDDDGTALPDPNAISKNANVKAKEKTPEKLGLECTVPPATPAPL